MLSLKTNVGYIGNLSLLLICMVITFIKHCSLKKFTQVAVISALNIKVTRANERSNYELTVSFMNHQKERQCTVIEFMNIVL